jgi:hypothetical protein
MMHWWFYVWRTLFSSDKVNAYINLTDFFFATYSKISFIPMSSLETGAHDRNAPGVIHFVPDGDNRRGAITCLAVSSHDEGKQLHTPY